MPTLLTFGARNVGRVLARELAREGWNTAAVARTQGTIDVVREQVPGVLGIVADATSSAAVEQAIGETRTRFGSIDLVVSAITNGPRSGSILELPQDSWAATAFATRALTQSAAAELRPRMVHVVLLIVDAVIESEKTEEWMRGEPPEKFASMEEIAKAIAYLHDQSPRAWTHELQLTPALETWVP